MSVCNRPFNPLRHTRCPVCGHSFAAHFEAETVYEYPRDYTIPSEEYEC